MKKIWIMGLSLLLLLVGCSQEAEDNTEQYDSLVPVEVSVSTEPATLKTNTPITVSAKVTQGTENVEDAREVVFEFWKEGQKENHVKIEGEHQGAGVYAVEKAFDQSGTYYVYAHVTAREMHVMPKEKLIVAE